MTVICQGKIPVKKYIMKEKSGKNNLYCPLSTENNKKTTGLKQENPDE
jgi:hypothetical protein